MDSFFSSSMYVYQSREGRGGEEEKGGKEGRRGREGGGEEEWELVLAMH